MKFGGVVAALSIAFIVVVVKISGATAEVGTAASYSLPYIPTRCWGNDQSRFPANSLFASAGEVVWDNGAACGRRYRVRCISGGCKGGFVDVVVVDQCRGSPCPSTLLLSNSAFQAISRNPNTRVNVEYLQI